jgi:hypothetical protein
MWRGRCCPIASAETNILKSIKTNDLKMKGPWGKMTKHNGIGGHGVDMTDKIF